VGSSNRRGDRARRVGFNERVLKGWVAGQGGKRSKSKDASGWERDGQIIHRLRDLHKEATVERRHYYTGRCISDAINEITRLRKLLALS
jgi:hypothetical protein